MPALSGVVVVNKKGSVRAVVLAGLILFTGACAATPDYTRLHSDTAGKTAANQDLNASLSLLAGKSQTPGDYAIGPEDLLEVTLFDIEDTTGEPRLITSRVSNTGYVTLPWVGKIMARGYTPLAFEEHLRKNFARFIHRPQITVFVREYRSYEISIVGYVEKPGVVQLRGRKTLLDALSLAGGLNEEAGHNVRLSREIEVCPEAFLQKDGGQANSESLLPCPRQVVTELIDLDRLTRDGDMRLNPELLPGDVINVPRAGVFYVEGMVNKPGAYPLLQDTTVSQALATAGGIDVALAKGGDTTLYRKMADGQRRPIPVRFDQIREGRAEDFLLQEDDLIVVPVSGPKFVVDRVLGLVRVGVAY